MTKMTTIGNAMAAAGASAFASSDKLSLIHWHIDRYDRIRASTSARAGVLLSGDAALLAGTILLSNNFLHDAKVATAIVWLMRVLSILTIALAAGSINFCANAVASWRTTRQIHKEEIPSRFLFNFNDTLTKDIDGPRGFVTKVTVLKEQDAINSAAAELWTAILQHKRRHKHLRYGIHAFRASALLFLMVAAILVFF